MAEVDERIREHLAAQNAVEGRGGLRHFRTVATVSTTSTLDDQPITLSE
jgi:hypothetical protein